MRAAVLTAATFKTEAQKLAHERARDFLHALFGEVNVTAMGDAFLLEEGSTFVYVRAAAVGEKKSCVEVFSYVALDVEVTEALMRYLLTYNVRLVLGGFGLVGGEDGKGTVVLSHSMLGETLTKEELYASVSAVARVADTLDDEIVKTFGGKTAPPLPLVDVCE